MDAITIFCDGLCEPRNPGGWACWAWVAYSPKRAQLRSAHGCLGHGAGMTNNRAEYTAVINALRYALSRIDLLVEREIGMAIQSDSQLVINQIAGAYRVNQAHLAELRSDVVHLESRFTARGVPITFTWIPREQNTVADALSRKAYQEARGERPELEPGEFVLPESVTPEQCRSCGAVIVWTRTPTGKPVPLSLALVEQHGALKVAKTHFVDCPESRQWKR